MVLIGLLAAALMLVPAPAGAEPITIALFGAAFAATLAGSVVGVAEFLHTPGGKNLSLACSNGLWR